MVLNKNKFREEKPKPPPARKITDYKKPEPDFITDSKIRFEEMNAERELRRREKEIQLVNIVGGILGIGTLIYAGFAYGIKFTIILFLVILANNLCNVK